MEAFDHAYFTKYLAQEKTLQREVEAFTAQVKQDTSMDAFEAQNKIVIGVKDEETALLQTIREKMEQLEILL